MRSSFVRFRGTVSAYPGVRGPNRYPRPDPGAVKTVLNVIWLVVAGFWLAAGYLLATILLAITIIGLPFARQSLKLVAADSMIAFPD